MKATVIWFHTAKNFGFVKADDGRDAILYRDELELAYIEPDSITKGTVLDVEFCRGPKGPVARRVSLIEHAPPKERKGHAPAPRDNGVVTMVHPAGKYAFCNDQWGQNNAFIGAKIVEQLDLKVGDKISYECRLGDRGLFACHVERVGLTR